MRERMLTLLADRSKRLRKRLADVLLLAAAAQELLDQEEIGKPCPLWHRPGSRSHGRRRTGRAISGGAARFKRTGYFGSCLADAAGAGRRKPLRSRCRTTFWSVRQRTFIFRYPPQSGQRRRSAGAGGFLRVGGADGGAGGGSVRPVGGAAPASAGRSSTVRKTWRPCRTHFGAIRGCSCPSFWGVGTVMPNFVQSALAVSFYFVESVKLHKSN